MPGPDRQHRGRSGGDSECSRQSSSSRWNPIGSLRSPARGVSLLPVNATRSRHLERDEVTAIAAATATEYRPMVWLGAFLGLRWSEVAGLRVGRLDLLLVTGPWRYRLRSLT